MSCNLIWSNELSFRLLLFSQSSRLLRLLSPQVGATVVPEVVVVETVGETVKEVEGDDVGMMAAVMGTERSTNTT